MTFEDDKNAQETKSWLQSFVFPAYLTFSVCFYSMRFFLGWGAPITTYESDMPVYIAALKDLVWLGLLGVTIFSLSFGRAIGQLKRHRSIYVVLAAFCAWMLFCSAIHVLFFYEPSGESFMYHIRYPLEYVPAALMAPAFIGDWRQLGILWKRLNWVALAFAGFEFVAVVGGWRQTGFGWGGVTSRFGGIFGAPNDWGVYSGCAILAILALTKTRTQLVGFVPALILTQSRSAMAGFLVATTPLLFRSDFRRLVTWSIALVFVIGLSVSFVVPIDYSDEPLPGHAGLDESALTRVDQMHTFQQKFRNLDDFPALLFGVQRFPAEPFYMALVVRGGVPALALYVVAIGMSISRGWRLRRSSIPHLIALGTVILISTASMFVPFPDIYPTNFYLWLAIGVLWMEPISLRLNPQSFGVGSACITPDDSTSYAPSNGFAVTH